MHKTLSYSPYQGLIQPQIIRELKGRRAAAAWGISLVKTLPWEKKRTVQRSKEFSTGNHWWVLSQSRPDLDLLSAAFTHLWNQYQGARFTARGTGSTSQAFNRLPSREIRLITIPLITSFLLLWAWLAFGKSCLPELPSSLKWNALGKAFVST